tara:strand:+ start:248 stop:406 length:159 start_codon:yes stop_codon:yes gene_type:complete
MPYFSEAELRVKDFTFSKFISLFFVLLSIIWLDVKKSFVKLTVEFLFEIAFL